MEDFLYGTLGGAFGTFIGHPIDTLRVQYQTNKGIKTVRECIKRSYNEGGARIFYRGLSYPLFGMMIEKAYVFGGYHNLKRYFEKNIELDNTKSSLLTGGIIGFLTPLITNPIEKFKIELQYRIQKTKPKANYNNFYRGLGAMLLRETIGYSIYFYIYEKMKENGKTTSFMNGFMAGIGSWVFIYPFDLCKTNIQSNKELTYRKFIKDIYNKKGLKGFYKGSSLALLRAGIIHGGVFWGYETTKKLIDL